MYSLCNQLSLEFPRHLFYILHSHYAQSEHIHQIRSILIKKKSKISFFHMFYRFGSLLFKYKSRKENPQKLTQLSSRSHPRHLVGKITAQKDTIIDITSESQVNSNFPYRWSPASLTFNNYFYLFLYLYIT